LSLIEKVARAVSLPVVAHGGAGKLSHVAEALAPGRASAVAIASMVHYEYVSKHGMQGDFETEGNLEFMRSGKEFSKFQLASIADIKNHLHGYGISCRRNSAGAFGR
jgi:cyclase